jgi:hypothetical protein
MRKSFFVTGMNIEVFHKDIETVVDWKTAIRRAERFEFNGGGWRLPTVKELAFLNTLFEIGIGGFADRRDYWSSEVFIEEEQAWTFEIGYGWPWKSRIDDRHGVRPVRDIISK